MSDQPMRLVHWPACKGEPCNCAESGAVLFSNAPQFAPRPNSDTPGEDFDFNRVTCFDCGWNGWDFELKAQACPVCDGRVKDV